MVAFTNEQKAAYLAAFIDGEGYVSFHRANRKIIRRIGFSNTDKALFDFVLSIGGDLGFSFAARPKAAPKKANHTQGYDAHLLGGRDAFERFEALVPLQSEPKKQRLRDLLAGYLSPEERAEVRRQTMANTFADKPARILRGQAAAKGRWGEDYISKWPSKSKWNPVKETPAQGAIRRAAWHRRNPNKTPEERSAGIKAGWERRRARQQLTGPSRD